MGKRFGDVRVRGRRYGLAHLAPLLLAGTTDAFPQERIGLLVTFASHCWSVAFDRDAHTPDLAFTDEAGRRRAFCASRHADSFALRDAFAEAWSLDLEGTGRRNFRIRVPGTDGLHAFARLSPSRQRRADVHCLVQTAYRPTVPVTDAGPATRMADAVNAALGVGRQGRPMRPADQRIWPGALATAG